MNLVGFFSFAAWLFYGGAFAALLWLRYKRPDMERPYRVSYLPASVVSGRFDVAIAVMYFTLSNELTHYLELTQNTDLLYISWSYLYNDSWQCLPRNYVNYLKLVILN